MSKNEKVQSFREQFRLAMEELQQIVRNKESFDGNGRYTVRTIEIVDPSEYDAKAVQAIRKTLNVSQAVFAYLVGVSAVLVRSWERGVRKPAPVARRVMDQMRANPKQFAALVRPVKVTRGAGVGARPSTSTKLATSRRKSA